jgi:hypothetical protein
VFTQSHLPLREQRRHHAQRRLLRAARQQVKRAILSLLLPAQLSQSNVLHRPRQPVGPEATGGINAASCCSNTAFLGSHQGRHARSAQRYRERRGPYPSPRVPATVYVFECTFAVLSYMCLYRATQAFRGCIFLALAGPRTLVRAASPEGRACGAQRRRERRGPYPLASCHLTKHVPLVHRSINPYVTR